MHVAATFRKLGRGQGVTAETEIRLQAGAGIDGDLNASPTSPRQVLLTCSDDLSVLGLADGALRENITVTGLTQRDLPSGAVVTFESGASLRIMFHCEPCRVATDDTGIELSALRHHRGVLAVVLHSGDVGRGSHFEVTASVYPALPDELAERCHWMIEHIPESQVLTYQTLVHAVGAPRGAVRAVPKWLDKADPKLCPTHRVVPASRRPRNEAQERLLQQEGTLGMDGQVPASACWNYEESFYSPVWADDPGGSATSDNDLRSTSVVTNGLMHIGEPS